MYTTQTYQGTSERMSTQKSLLLSHPTGNANVRSLANYLLDENLLAEFHTSISVFDNQLLDYVCKLNGFASLDKRRFPQKFLPYTKQWPLREIARHIFAKIQIESLKKHEKGIFSIDKTCQYFDQKVANRIANKPLNNIRSIYAYEDVALASFIQAQKMEIQRLYELPIGYWRAAIRLLNEEKERRPDWGITLSNFKDSIEKQERKDQEITLANHIFVASSFTANTLNDFPGSIPPVHIIPYGFPEVYTEREYAPFKSNRRIKLLFVGGLSQRKGIANLFEAVEKLDKYIELTVVGLKTTDQCKPLNKGLKKHRWIPSLPHAEILKLMRGHDALIFPSLFEGFGLVITEAMSQGTPVITTDRTAGIDFINHEENGWLVEAGNSDSLFKTLEEIILQPESLISNGLAAIRTANHRPWSSYGSEIARTICDSL